MSEINYEQLVSELIKPLTTHPEDVKVTDTPNGHLHHVVVEVHEDDLGRVIGRKGRVANAIRTIAYAAAMRNKENLEVEFISK